MDTSDTDSSGGLFSPKRRPAPASEPASPNNAASPSPAKGSGAELQATSPRGQPGASKDRKDPKTGKTVVEVISYPKFDSNKEYAATVDKAAKYSGKWVPRYISLRDIDLAYGLSETATPKDTIRFHKVSRGSELGRDTTSIVVEGVSSKDRKPVEFVFKVKDADETEVWWLRCAHALAASNQMDMPREGLPLAHPKTGLAFVNIPVEHLAVFAPLDRLVLHFFAAATHKHKGIAGRLVDAPAFVFIGDLCVYICDPKADIKRCIGVRNITGLLSVAGGDSWTVGVQCSLPEYDILFSMEKKNAEQFASVLTSLHNQFGVPKNAKDTQGLKRQKLAKDALLLPQLSLDAPDGHALKIRLPMSKRYLMKMVADGEKGGQLKVVKKERSLATVAPTPAPSATGPTAGAKDGADDGKKAGEGASVSANPLSDLGKKTGATGDGKKDANPNDNRPPAPPSSDDDDDDSNDSLAGFMKKKDGPKPPPHAFDDSDSNDSSIGPKASPLSGAFGGSTQNRTDKPGPSPQTNTSSSGGVQLAMGVDRMHRLLNTVGLPQYYAVLTERGVDWEIFSCMDTIDLKKFGVATVEHQIKIENALNDSALMEALRKESASGGGGGPAVGAAFAPPPPQPQSGAGNPFGGAPPPPPPGGNKAAVFIDDDDL